MSYIFYSWGSDWLVQLLICACSFQSLHEEVSDSYLSKRKTRGGHVLNNQVFISNDNHDSFIYLKTKILPENWSRCITQAEKQDLYHKNINFKYSIEGFD